jgi:hypothetical protein
MWNSNNTLSQFMNVCEVNGKENFDGLHIPNFDLGFEIPVNEEVDIWGDIDDATLSQIPLNDDKYSSMKPTGIYNSGCGVT